MGIAPQDLAHPLLHVSPIPLPHQRTLPAWSKFIGRGYPLCCVVGILWLPRCTKHRWTPALTCSHCKRGVNKKTCKANYHTTEHQPLFKALFLFFFFFLNQTGCLPNNGITLKLYCVSRRNISLTSSPTVYGDPLTAARTPNQ